MSATFRVPITQGGFAVVDEADRPLVDGLKWSLNGSGYAQHCRFEGGVAILRVIMHRLLMAPKAGLVVDHINGDRLDNRRCNLRVCTNAENSRNRRPSKNAPFGYKGVRASGKSRFAAVVWLDNRSHKIGTFASAEEAARAYDEVIRVHHGAFARLNFPQIPAPLSGAST